MKKPPTRRARGARKRATHEAVSMEEMDDMRRPTKRKELEPAVLAAFDKWLAKAEVAGVNGLRAEFAEVKNFVPQDKYEAFHANRTKNRFVDVLCVDATRVVLTLNAPPDTDYIHANWVKCEQVQRPYIATQAPMEHTCEDFWRMIHQEQPAAILAIVNFMEGDEQRCFEYWPRDEGAYKNYGCMFVSTKKVEKIDKFTTYVIETLPDGCSNSTIVKLLHFTEWPDRGTPRTGHVVLRLLRAVVGIAPLQAPLVLHCSAGVGRTGTVIAIDVAVQRLLKGQDVDIKELFLDIRHRRAHSIQTEAQYLFIYSAICDYLRAKDTARFEVRTKKLQADIAVALQPPKDKESIT